MLIFIEEIFLKTKKYKPRFIKTKEKPNIIKCSCEISSDIL